MPPLSPPISAEVSVSPENVTTSPFALLSVVIISTFAIALRLWFPCIAITTLDRELKAFNEFLNEAEARLLPPESVHRRSLSDRFSLEHDVSCLKRMGYEIQEMNWSVCCLKFYIWNQPRSVIKHFAVLEKIRLRAMADVEREKQALDNFARRRRHAILFGDPS
ncbi:hypothetical protein Moror_7899 [Moniliophthora roreri MCA 2997]|uniref:Uncharacterized protein n=2 Tax=Moniliophthora roreri TaxID=221103 RepID=V2YEB8_MONRO|nr:hypothetical protein Moror_7899 [Moniliophthora roreri MCA 2997]KAI3608960.1 hypothetical protein WG66_010902 [Moniliophthora roreri]